VSFSIQLRYDREALQELNRARRLQRAKNLGGWVIWLGTFVPPLPTSCVTLCIVRRSTLRISVPGATRVESLCYTVSATCGGIQGYPQKETSKK
jgi:hypothetical protein